VEVYDPPIPVEELKWVTVIVLEETGGFAEEFQQERYGSIS